MADGSRWQVTRAGVFLVVGIVAAVFLTYGGLWLVKERGEAVRREVAIQTAEQQLRDQADQSGAASTDQSTDSSQGQASDNASNNQTATTQSTGPTTMPQTGPAELAGSIVAVGAIVYTATLYHQSRRAAAWR